MHNSMHDTAHTFAFYSDAVRTIRQQIHFDSHQIADPELIHRIATVLRLSKGDSVIFFDSDYHVKATIVGFDSKRSITIQLHEIIANKRLTPSIQWLLPLLKREALEDALYSLTELGATSIQPLLTTKTTRSWGGEKEIVRYERIMIAAAEQSKQFIIPQLHPIIPLDIWLMKQHSPLSAKIFFDAAGIPLREAIGLIEHQKYHDIIALVGPEGDLTYEEKAMLTDQGFIFCALTPTVLRARQAITIGLGALRSLLV